MLSTIIHQFLLGLFAERAQAEPTAGIKIVGSYYRVIHAHSLSEYILNFIVKNLYTIYITTPSCIVITKWFKAVRKGESMQRGLIFYGCSC
jgi:hypothetical protein